MELKETFQKVKAASKTLGLLSDEQRNEILQAVADAIIAETPALLAANAEDLAKMDKANPLYDRLQLTEQRLQDIASDMRHVSTLPSPLGRVLKDKTLENGLHLQRVAVPFGVIGMIYEARPNVTYDVFSLCFKSGNACVLKGGKDANASNSAGVELIHKVLITFGIDPNVVTLLPATHEATGEMLNDVLRKHLVGGIEEGNVRSHGVSPCVCCPVARRFLSDIRTMAHERIVYIYIYRCTVALCLPVARHCNLIPLAHVVVCRLEAFGTFFGIR